jgi:hypothetical protein
VFAVLESVCALNQDMNEEVSFNKYSNIISMFLEKKAVQLIKDLQHRKVDTIRLLEDNLTPTCHLIHKLIYQLIISFTYSTSIDATIENSLWLQPTISFDSIIKHSHEWLEIRRIFNSNNNLNKNKIKSKKLKNKQPSSTTTLITNVSNILCSIESNILDDTVILKDLNIISSQIDSFLELLEAFKLNINVPIRITRRLLEYLSSYLHRFNHILDCMQVYSSFFCSMGVRCEQNEMKLIIDNLRNNYDNIKLNMIANSFKDILISIPEVCWLYDLRTSELFLENWRRIGRQICMETLSNSDNIVDKSETNMEFLALSAMFEGGDQEGVVIENENIDDSNLTEEQRIQLAINKFALQNSKKLLKTKIDEVVLTQDTVVNNLIVYYLSIYLSIYLLAVDLINNNSMYL